MQTDQTSSRNALEARLELAERALVYSNRNIQITTEILIQASEEVLPLLVERTENSANIATLVQRIREQVESETERELLDIASASWLSAYKYGPSLHQLIDKQRSAAAGQAMANVMLPFLLDNASWRAFVQFLRAQVGPTGPYKQWKRGLASRASEFVRANQELKSAVAERGRIAERLSQLASIVECSNDAIIMHTLDGTIASWNIGAESVYGYSAHEVVGRPRSVLLPGDQPDELPAILEMLKRGERTELKETIHIGKYQRRIEVSEMLSPVKDASGKIVGAVAITRDISGRRTPKNDAAEPSFRGWEVPT
ncbi:MAG TPA: PAS domain S-box protein [Candidatus Acidoferrum sp.]|jgi:PAS domain S-box-containing protein|nr:PAS domain S-box protein [Candidatus Acidoferrum sp.]